MKKQNKHKVALPAISDEEELIEDIDEEEKPTPEDSLKGARNMLIVLMVCAVLAFGAFAAVRYYNNQKLAGPEERYTYNYYPFEKKDGIWWTYTQSGNNLYQVAMRYGPRELESIKIEGDIPAFRDKWGFYYITIDPTEKSFGNITMAHAEISMRLVPHFNKGLGAACTVMTDDCIKMNATFVGCGNSTLPVIFLDQSPGPAVIVDGNCATIRGEGEDIVKAADRFMYSMYGIMR